MDEEPQNSYEIGAGNDSLESPELTPIASESTGPPDEGTTPPKGPGRFKRMWRWLIKHFNVYLLLFILLLAVAGAIVLLTYSKSQRNSASLNLGSKSLSATSLAQLANSDATVGSADQTLNVQSSAVFAGNVLARQDLDVAGNLNIGGTLSLNDLDVAGTTQLSQAQINSNLAVAGSSSLQGAVTIAKSLQVNGGGNFEGGLSAAQLTTSALQLNGDLTLTHHIVAGGVTPSRTAGDALGSGGSTSLSGSDTAGSIAIGTGSNPAAGCFITINFNAKYNNTPHVLVTPVGAAAAGLSYYINRSGASFSVCDATPPPANSSFGFDYFVVD
jgi:cytoskeletal protein CcmA (bactofilin family)